MIKAWQQGDINRSTITCSPERTSYFIGNIDRKGIVAKVKSTLFRNTKNLRAESGNSFKKAMLFCQAFAILSEKRTDVDTRALVYS